MQSFRERLASPQPLLMDGALGTELQRRGLDLSAPSWTALANRDAAEQIVQIHCEYVRAGAELLTANTFRCHARNVGHDPLLAQELVQQAIELARRAAGPDTFIAGSQAPLEDCYSPALAPATPALEREHGQMAEGLADAGVDLILVETQNNIREAVVATRAALATGLPVITSLICDRTTKLLSGEFLETAVRQIGALEPAAVLVNCLPPAAVMPALHTIRGHFSGPRGAFANTGYLNTESQWVATDATEPSCYAQSAVAWRDDGAVLLGGCCGTTPGHIAALHSALHAAR